MKLFLILFISQLSSFASAQEAGISTAKELTSEEKLSKAKDVVFEVSATGQTSHKGIFRAGLLLKEQWLIGGSYSKYQTQSKDSGGDLSTWNYVEQDSDAKMEVYMVELTYFLYPIKTRPLTPYGRIGIGRATQRVSYGYNRFKPYNGTFCIGPCPEKAVEESDSGSFSEDKNIFAAGAGYVWTFVMGRAGLSLRGGVAYSQLPSISNRELGSSRRRTVNGIEASPFSLELGLGVEIPLF
jgi:hypothetical protein